MEHMTRLLIIAALLAAGCRSIGTVAIRDCDSCTIVIHRVEATGEMPKTVDIPVDATATGVPGI